MAYGAYDGPNKPDKGQEGGSCNRTRCQCAPANHYNHGSYAWYCKDCARDIGQDPVNKRGWERDWQPRLGHPMFETRGQMDDRIAIAAAIERLVSEMEQAPFEDDVHLQGTTQQRLRFEHYARLAALHLGQPAYLIPPRRSLEKAILGRTVSKAADAVLVLLNRTAYTTADEKADAARFRALLRCGRIKMQGSSGVDPHTGERNGNNVHFGAEFWPEPPSPEFEERELPGTEWGRACIRALADAILEIEAGTS